MNEPTRGPEDAMVSPNRQESAMEGIQTRSNSTSLQVIYLILALLGAVLPWLANLEFIKVHGGGFDLGLFINLASANPAAQSLSRDLLVSSTAVSIWIVVEARRLKMRGLTATLALCFGVAFACGAPFFLFLRERRLQELSLTNRGPA